MRYGFADNSAQDSYDKTIWLRQVIDYGPIGFGYAIEISFLYPILM
jgi:hypothetical protein